MWYLIRDYRDVRGTFASVQAAKVAARERDPGPASKWVKRTADWGDGQGFRDEWYGGPGNAYTITQRVPVSVRP